MKNINKIKLSIISGILLYSSSLMANVKEQVTLETSADALISKDLLRSSILKDKKFEYELENLKLMKEEVAKNNLSIELEKDKIKKSFSANDLIEKETYLKNKKLDYSLSEADKRIEYLNKYPMTMLGIDPQKKDLIVNIAEAELEKAKNTSEVAKNSSNLNKNLRNHANILNFVYQNNSLIKEHLTHIDNSLNGVNKIADTNTINVLKSLVNKNLSSLDAIAFNEQNSAIYGEDMIKLRKTIFSIKNKIDFFPIYNMKSNGDSIMKQEIDKIEPMINYTNELLSNLMNKNYQNTTISPMASNNSKKGKSVEKRIDMLEVYKNLLQNLKSDKMSVSDVKNQLKIKDNFNKNEMVKYLTNKIKKMESDRKREAYIANQKRKARLEEMKIKMELAKTEAERRKIQEEENARIANENKIKAEELARIEADKAEKLRIELADENDLKNNYKIIGYFNGVLTLKNTQTDTKIKIYKNTKVKSWTFLNWKESSMEATFEKNGKFITKKLKQSMDNVSATKEEIGETKTSTSTSKTSTNEVIETVGDTTGTQKN